MDYDIFQQEEIETQYSIIPCEWHTNKLPYKYSCQATLSPGGGIGSPAQWHSEIGDILRRPAVLDSIRAFCERALPVVPHAD